MPILNRGKAKVKINPKTSTCKLNSHLIWYIAKNGTNNNATKKKSNKYLFISFDKIMSLFFMGIASSMSVSFDACVAEALIIPRIARTDTVVVHA